MFFFLIKFINGGIVFLEAMQITIPIFLIFLLLIPSALAGNSYDTDFSEIPTQAILLYEHDEVRFSILGGEHMIIIEDVGKASVKLDIGAFIGNNTELWPGLVGFDTINKIDLDKDGTDDLGVALYGIAEDGQVHLVLQDLTQKTDQEVTGDVPAAGKLDDTFSYRNVLLALIGVLILAVVVALVFRNTKGNSSDTGESEEKTVELPDEVEQALKEDDVVPEVQEDYGK